MYIINLKKRDIMKKLKQVRGKRNITEYKNAYSVLTILYESHRHWSDIFKVLKKNLATNILYPAKIYFK